MMLKLNQKVVLVCQETIGIVVNVNEQLNKAVIRANKNGENFDFIVTKEGYLPYSETPMVENIPFMEGETIVKPLGRNIHQIGRISNITLSKDTRGILTLIGTFNPLGHSIEETITLRECTKLSCLQQIIQTEMEKNDLITQ